MKIYSYKNSMKTMKQEEVAKILLELEKKLRTGKFQSVPMEINQAQMASIKQSWSPEVLGWMKLSLRQSIGEKPPDYPSLTAAVLATYQEEARKRSKAQAGRSNLASITTKNFKQAATDFALCLALRLPPDPTNAEPKRIMGETVMRWQCSNKMVNLVVDDARIDEATVYLMSYYDEQLHRAWLVGWASQEDVRKAPQRTDKAARNVASLRPMSELLASLGINSVPEGVVFETVPKIEDIPNSADMPIIESDAGDKFDETIFGPATKTKNPPATAGGQ